VNCWIGVEEHDGRRIVRLAGEFRMEQVIELLTVCDPDRDPGELDLSELVWADTAGLEALQRLRNRGVSFVGTPAYIQLKLDSMARGRPVPGPVPKRR
jgi:hypothetical protein